MIIKDAIRRSDKVFLFTTLLLVGIGLVMFLSASAGIAAKDSSKFTGILLNQIGLGFGVGGVLFLVGLLTPYSFWRNKALVIFILALGLTALVFVPGLGFSHGGALRWISLGPISFQPAEVLKIASVIYFSAWLAWSKKQKFSDLPTFLPLVFIIGSLALILLSQPDTKSLLLILTACIALVYTSGISIKYILSAGAVLIVGAGVWISQKSYVLDRIVTYLNPLHDPQGVSWQLTQSLIAIGSGGFFGRGLGQSIQKFTYLPEPHGDSIFSVIGEELGFVGAIVILFLYIIFVLRGYKIALRVPDDFARFLIIGLVTMIGAQSFLNIGALTGVLPLTGVPLVFMSHGGTSLALSLFAVGVILNISKYQRNKA